jgi:hypothetical protein
LLKLLTCPLILLTLGLFTLVVDAITLLLASRIATDVFGVGFFVDGFWPAFWGAIIVSLVSVVLNILVDDDRDDRPGVAGIGANITRPTVCAGHRSGSGRPDFSPDHACGVVA